MRALNWFVLFPCAAIACGGGGDQSDGGEDASVDHAAIEASADASDASVVDVGLDVPVDNWVAPEPPYARNPTVDYLGGHLLTSAKIVTVSFAGDDSNLITRLQDFDDTITSTAWWKASTAEYCELPKGPCIGPGSNGGHVVLSETAPANLVDTDDGKGSTVVSFIQSHVTSGALPAPDDQTIYMLFFPSGTNITFDSDKSCNSFGAYHYSATLTMPGDAGTQETSYAVEPRCNYGETFLTQAASHELIEAATDAQPGKLRGFVMQDISWNYYGDEVGDLCDHPWGGVFDIMTTVSYDGGAPYTVQRGWSNVSALAGHDPCVIAPSDHPYFNAAVETGKQSIYLAVGESTTIQVQGFADGTMADWTLSVVDMGSHYGAGSNNLTLSLDKTTMNNLQTADLTITLAKKPNSTWVPYALDSKDGAGHEHQWGASVYLKE